MSTIDIVVDRVIDKTSNNKHIVGMRTALCHRRYRIASALITFVLRDHVPEAIWHDKQA